MMRLIRASAFVAAAGGRAAATAGCGGGASTNTSGEGGGGGGGTSPATLTYWASDQGSGIADDYSVLNPQLKKFQQQTGVTVNLGVIGWPDLLNRVLAAITSGQRRAPSAGPDRIVLTLLT